MSSPVLHAITQERIEAAHAETILALEKLKERFDAIKKTGEINNIQSIKTP